MASLIVFFAVGIGTSVLGQSIQQQQFVKFSTYPASIDANTEKVYRTTLTTTTFNLNASMDPNRTVFEATANELYNISLQGFISLTMITDFTSTDNNISSTTWTYDVRYNYTTLYSTISGSDEAIAETIGNSTFLKIGFESDPVFSSLYNVSTSGFIFTGNIICGNAAECDTYTTCNEARDGITVNCLSVCFDDFCLNGGYCHHDDPNTRPICSCASFFDSWYVGDHCQTLFQVWMMALFFVIVFLILVALIPMIACLCIKQIPKRIRKKKEKAKKALEKERLKNGIANGTTAVEKKTSLAAVPLNVEPTGNIRNSINTTPTSTPVPAPRTDLSTSTLERHESTSSADSTTTTTSSSSHNETETHRSDQTSITEETISRVQESGNSTLYQSLAGSTRAHNESHPTSSNSSSDTSNSDDSSGISIQDPLPPIRYVDPPVYALVVKPNLEEPLVSTV